MEWEGVEQPKRKQSGGLFLGACVSAKAERLSPSPPGQNNPKLVIVGNCFGFSLFLDKVKAGGLTLPFFV